MSLKHGTQLGIALNLILLPFPSSEVLGMPTAPRVVQCWGQDPGLLHRGCTSSSEPHSSPHIASFCIFHVHMSLVSLVFMTEMFYLFSKLNLLGQYPKDLNLKKNPPPSIFSLFNIVFTVCVFTQACRMCAAVKGKPYGVDSFFPCRFQTSRDQIQVI